MGYAFERLDRADEAELCYREACEDPPCLEALAWQAAFLFRCRGDIERAHAAYEAAAAAIARAPEGGAALGAPLFYSYGQFAASPAGLRSVQKAERLFERAIECNGEHSESLGALAALLHARAHPAETDRVLQLYERAVAADPFSVNTRSNFGLFLADQAKDVVASERQYCRALELSPAHPNSCYNYGVLLESLSRRDEAEEFYRRAATGPEPHGLAAYNLALLLEENIGAEQDEAGRSRLRGECRAMFATAARLVPGDATIIADGGRFLAAESAGDPQQEEEAVQQLRRARAIDPANATACWNLALLRCGELKKSESREAAEEAFECFTALLEERPSHTLAFVELARLLAVHEGKLSQPAVDRALARLGEQPVEGNARRAASSLLVRSLRQLLDPSARAGATELLAMACDCVRVETWTASALLAESAELRHVIATAAPQLESLSSADRKRLAFLERFVSQEP